MQKQIHISGIVILVLLFSTGIVCYGNDLKSETESNYRLNVNIDVDDQNLRVSGSFNHILRESETDSVSFLVHSNMRFDLMRASAFQSVKEVSITDYKVKRIVFYDPKKPGSNEVASFHFSYSGQLKDVDMPWGIDKISENWIELSANSMWLPLVESFDVFSTVTAEVNLATEKGYELISSGKISEKGKNQFLVENHIPQIDFVILASDEFQTQKYKGTELVSSAPLSQSSENLLKLSSESQAWLNTRFGDKDAMEQVKLVMTPRKESGYARKNLIVLSDISGKSDLFLTEFITHELTHFWSTKVNPRSPHRWLDESIAQYVSMVYIRESSDADFYESELARYQKEVPELPHVYKASDSSQPSHAILYRKGVVKLDWLEQRIGFERMMSLFKKWFGSDYATTEGFLDLLGKEEGENMKVAFRNELEQ
jgi:hypothetical protein